MHSLTTVLSIATTNPFSLAFLEANADCTFKPTLAKGRATTLDPDALKRVATTSDMKPVVTKWEDDLEEFLKIQTSNQTKALSREKTAADRARRGSTRSSRLLKDSKAKAASSSRARKRDKSPVDAAPVDLLAFEDLI